MVSGAIEGRPTRRQFDTRCLCRPFSRTLSQGRVSVSVRPACPEGWLASSQWPRAIVEWWLPVFGTIVSIWCIAWCPCAPWAFFRRYHLIFQVFPIRILSCFFIHFYLLPFLWFFRLPPASSLANDNGSARKGKRFSGQKPRGVRSLWR